MPKSRVGKALTAERGPVHGNFEEGSRITQGAMAVFQSGSQWPKLTAGQKEAIHMIVHKIHRIVTGNPKHKDHWDDVGGYAQLGADACDAVEAVQPKARLRKSKKPAAKKVTAQRARPAAKQKTVRPVAKRATAKRTARVARPARRAPAPVSTAPAPVPEAA